LIGDHSDRNAFDSCVTCDHLLRVVRLELIEFSSVKQAIKHVSHIIRQPMVGRHDVVDVFDGVPRWTSVPDLHAERLRRWKLRYKLTQLRYTLFIVPGAEMRHARNFIM